MGKLDNIKIPDDFDSIINSAIERALYDKKIMKNRKRKTMVACISGVLILGIIGFNSDTAWAYIEKITKQIESYFGVNDKALDRYTFDSDLVCKDKGLKYTIEEIMLDDRQLIFTMTADYSNYIRKITLDKNMLTPNNPTIVIDDMVFAGQSYMCDVEKIPGEQKNRIIFKVTLGSIDTDNDGCGDEDVEILDKIKDNEDYNLNIYFNELENGQTGDWEFNTIINGTSIKADTKVYKVNKTIKIDENEYKGDFTIEEVRVSPFSVKVKYNYDLYDEISVQKRREPSTIALDENGNEIEIGPGEGGELKNRKWYIVYEYILKGNEDKITILPQSYVNEKQKIYEEGKYEIDLK